ncbi:MAG: hypothetical protein IJI75_01560 [Solobacterium sp.]|nr:hypothetical protein [Solobacterium sp.]
MTGYTVVYYDLTEKWTETISSARPLTCLEAVQAALSQHGKAGEPLPGLVYVCDGAQLLSNSVLPDGARLNVHRLLGGG